MKPCWNVVLGSGPLGLSVVHELVGKGEPVRLVNRTGKAPVPDTVEVVRADLSDSGRVYDVTYGAGIVYLCTAPRYTGWVEKFPALMRSIITGVQRSKARLVFGDNVSLYGKTHGLMTEDTPVNPTTKKGRVRAKIAGELLSAHTVGNLNVTIGRSADFFGPHVLESTMGEHIFLPLLKGKVVSPLGNIDLPHTFTYIRDFARALIVLGERPESNGCVYHVPNNETQSTRTVLEMAFRLAEMPVKIRLKKKWMLYLGGWCIPQAREAIEMMYQYEKPFIVDSSRFTQTFGLAATPLETALNDTIEWYRDKPE